MHRIVLLAFALNACATPIVRDGEWALSNLQGAPTDAPRPNLTIEGERMSGFAGCNRLTAQIETDPNVAAFFRGPVATTRMHCEGAAMDMERALLLALERTGDARIEDNMLIFFDVNNHEIMRFVRAR